MREGGVAGCTAERCPAGTVSWSGRVKQARMLRWLPGQPAAVKARRVGRLRLPHPAVPAPQPSGPAPPAAPPTTHLATRGIQAARLQPLRRQQQAGGLASHDHIPGRAAGRDVGSLGRAMGAAQGGGWAALHGWGQLRRGQGQAATAACARSTTPKDGLSAASCTCHSKITPQHNPDGSLKAIQHHTTQTAHSRPASITRPNGSP